MILIVVKKLNTPVIVVKELNTPDFSMSNNAQHPPFM